MKWEALSRSVFWTLAALAATGGIAICACVAHAAAGDSGPASLFALLCALQLLFDLYTMLSVRQGALEVNHPSTLTHRLLIFVSLLVQALVYTLVGINLVQTPSPIWAWVPGLMLVRACLATLAWLGVATALWGTRDTPFNNARAKQAPDQSTGLPDDEMNSNWDEGNNRPPP